MFSRQLSRYLFLSLSTTLFISTATDAKQICSTTYTPPTRYLSLKKSLDEKLNKFSNSPAIAKQADHLLSKLLAAKSSVITSWLQKRNLQNQDEEKIVRAWRQYFATNFILSKYPHNDQVVDNTIEVLVEEIKLLFADKTFIKKMEGLFVQSQKAAIKTIKNWNFEQKVQEALIARISTMKLYWLKSFKSSKFKSLPLEYIDWGIAYDPGPNEINMGIHSLAYPNDETYLAVFAHEIGHSFDSCRWGAFFAGDWPFQKVGECLRSNKSVGAKKRDDSKMEKLIKNGQLNSELALALKMNPTCNKTLYPPPGTQADQLPETFADWFSAEVMATLGIKAKSALRADLCENKNLMKGSSYISNQERLQKIYFAHPKFRSTNDVAYCAMKAP